MKKLFLLALILFSIQRMGALPVGNPSEASLFFQKYACGKDYCDESIWEDGFITVGIGYYGDYVFNRHLETVTDRKIDYSQIYTNAGLLVLNVCDRVDLFTTLGTTKFKFNTSLGPFNSGNKSPRFDFETRTAFSWSVGGRATLLEYRCFALGLVGQYFSSHPQAKVLFVRANVDNYPDENSRRKYSEWQVGAGISYHYSYYFMPYVAIKYARAFWEFDNETFNVTGTLATIPNVRSSRNWGYAIGITLPPFTCTKMAVTVEARFADEAALYVNGQIRF